jgi:hypothetical protein
MGSGHLQAPAAFIRGKKPRYSLYRRLGGPHSQSGRCEEENLLLVSKSNNDNSVVQSVKLLY